MPTIFCASATALRSASARRASAAARAAARSRSCARRLVRKKNLSAQKEIAQHGPFRAARPQRRLVMVRSPFLAVSSHLGIRALVKQSAHDAALLTEWVARDAGPSAQENLFMIHALICSSIESRLLNIVAMRVPDEQQQNVQISHQRSSSRYNLVGVARLFGLCKTNPSGCGRERAGEFSAWRTGTEARLLARLDRQCPLQRIARSAGCWPAEFEPRAILNIRSNWVQAELRAMLEPRGSSFSTATRAGALPFSA
jgi:hypothetical protein